MSKYQKSLRIQPQPLDYISNILASGIETPLWDGARFTKMRGSKLRKVSRLWRLTAGAFASPGSPDHNITFNFYIGEFQSGAVAGSCVVSASHLSGSNSCMFINGMLVARPYHDGGMVPLATLLGAVVCPDGTVVPINPAKATPFNPSLDTFLTMTAIAAEAGCMINVAHASLENLT
jgi:hypothetical protein